MQPDISRKLLGLLNKPKFQKALNSQMFLTLLLINIRGSSLVLKFVFTLFLAKYLGLEALGFFGLVTASTIVVPMFLSFGLGYVLCRRAVTSTPVDLVLDTKFYWLFTAFSYFPLIVIVCVYGQINGNPVLWISVVLVVCFEHLNTTAYQLLQNLSRPIAANILHFVRNTIWAAVFMLIAFLWPNTRNIEYLMIFWVFGSALSFSQFLWLIKDWPWSTPMPKSGFLLWLKKELPVSKSAYILGVFDTLSTYQDRYLIGWFIGLELVGVFVFFWQITSALSNLLWTGIVQVTRPKLVKAFNSSDPSYNNIYHSCLFHALLGAVLASVFSIVALIFLLPYLNKPLVSDMFGVYYLMLIAFLLSVIRETQKLKFYSQHRDDIIAKINAITFLSASVNRGI